MINNEYCVNFYANLSNLTGLATNNLGMYFSNSHTLINGNQYLNEDRRCKEKCGEQENSGAVSQITKGYQYKNLSL